MVNRIGLTPVAGLDPATHVFSSRHKTWTAGSGPAEGSFGMSVTAGQFRHTHDDALPCPSEASGQGKKIWS